MTPLSTHARLLVALVITASVARAQTPDSLEGTSLLGRALYRAPLPPSVRLDLEARLIDAAVAVARNPDDPEVLIWLGRRTAYLGHLRDARAIFTEGIRRFPGDARFLRHRGHRYLSVRLLDSAIADLTAAWALTRGRQDEIELDGLPNARNIPTSTLQSNICYHLALAHYLKGDFANALPVWRDCETVSKNPDMLVATRYWHYMTLRRMGRADDAGKLLADIHPGMDIIENGAYHRLLLLNKGTLPLDSLVRPGGGGITNLDAAVNDASLWYGIGNWHFYNGRREEADRVFRRILDGTAWGAFGYIAAEAEVARRQ